MMRLQHISKTYHTSDQAISVLEACSMEISRGEWLSIMGPSGSGKSTLMCILGCLDTADSGQYWLDGQDVSGMTETNLAHVRHAKIGFVFQSFHLISHYTALHNVMLPLVYAGTPRSLRQQKAIQALVTVGLAHRLHHFPPALSGGERQRVAIARALVNDPEIILADEPTGNLDSGTGKTIMALFQHMHTVGKTIVMVTHDDAVAGQAQRVIRMADGRVRHA